jgi:hypothetical protein
MTLEPFHIAAFHLIGEPAFPLGHLVMTPNAARSLTRRAMLDALRRHASGDWGDLPGEDASQNDAALCRGGGRLFSSYSDGPSRFWIITEADRSVTTILLPLDY